MIVTKIFKTNLSERQHGFGALYQLEKDMNAFHQKHDRLLPLTTSQITIDGILYTTVTYDQVVKSPGL